MIQTIDIYALLNISHMVANHKSAKKRSRQTLKRSRLNKPILNKVKTSLSKFNALIDEKDPEALQKSWSTLNSTLARAVKKGLIKKQHMSRKLSSLSHQLKNIS